MKAAARPLLLASVLALTLATPALGASKEHDAGVTCATDTTSGVTSCFAWESDTRVTDGPGSVHNVKLQGTSSSSQVDASGTVTASYDQAIRQKAVVVDTSDGAVYRKLDTRQVEEITENGSTRCVVTHVVVRNGAEVTNEVVTTDGPC